jgi:hypothetical protein
MLKKIMLGVILLTLPSCQSGCFSRVGLGSATLELPSDIKTPVSFAKTNNRKYLMYISVDGVLKVKEYSDYGILEAEYVFTGKTF